MSEFERQIYADLKSTDRVSLWVAKCMELAEFSCILTDEDIDGIAMVVGPPASSSLSGSTRS